MKCKDVLPHMSAYHDGELQGEQILGLERHLRVCEACREEYQRIRNVGSWLDEMVVHPIPPGFAGRVMAEASRRKLPKRGNARLHPTWWHSFRWFVGLSAPMRMAALVVVLLACLLGVFLSKETSWPERRQEYAAGADAMSGLEWFSATPPDSLGSAYLAYAARPTAGENP